MKSNNPYWAKGFVSSFFLGILLSIVFWLLNNPLEIMNSTSFREGFMLPIPAPFIFLIFTTLFVLCVSLIGVFFGWLYGKFKS